MRVEQALAYPEDTAGSMMNTDTITVRSDVSVDVPFVQVLLETD
jgi:magnesium transporter